MPKLSDVITALEEVYPPQWAEAWDAVGLVCGDPQAEVGRVLFAVDPVQAVVDEAVEWGADLVVTHHPSICAAPPASPRPPSRAGSCTR